MTPVLELLAVAFGFLASVLVLANIILVVASLTRRRERALRWLAPFTHVAALLLLSDSPGNSGGTQRKGGVA